MEKRAETLPQENKNPKSLEENVVRPIYALAYRVYGNPSSVNPYNVTTSCGRRRRDEQKETLMTSIFFYPLFLLMKACGFAGSVGSMNAMSTVLSSLKSTGLVR